jgi:hypothetical protein
MPQSVLPRTARAAAQNAAAIVFPGQIPDAPARSALAYVQSDTPRLGATEVRNAEGFMQ